jgi:hypothetical protein
MTGGYVYNDAARFPPVATRCEATAGHRKRIALSLRSSQGRSAQYLLQLMMNRRADFFAGHYFFQVSDGIHIENNER